MVVVLCVCKLNRPVYELNVPPWSFYLNLWTNYEKDTREQKLKTVFQNYVFRPKTVKIGQETSKELR